MRILGNIRAWFTRSFNEKRVSLIHLIYRKTSIYFEDSISVPSAPPPISTIQLIETETGLFVVNIAKRGRRLTITLKESTHTPSTSEWYRALAILASPNGLANLLKEGHILLRSAGKK